MEAITNFGKYLASTTFIESESEIVKKLKIYFSKKYSSKVDLAIAYFYYVRDSFKYSITLDFTDINIYKSSTCLGTRKSFCMPKAAALSALARASDIPARLHFADLKNKRIPEHLYNTMGSDTFYWHCYAELYLNDKWVKATPSFDLNTCLRHNLPPVEFDGYNDALFASHDDFGNPYCEYIKDRGVYADIPIKEIWADLAKYYGHLDATFLKQ